MSDAPFISVRNVSKTFEKDGRKIEVLKDISFDVQRRETVCILGGSGGGKSTLLKVMIGALRPTSGEVIIDGQNIVGMSDKALNKVRRRFGVLFQSGALLNSMSVYDNVALPIEFHTEHEPDTIEIIVNIKLEQVKLSHAAHRLPSEISGGMVKRAGLARAIALDPQLVFYDEPSAGLDPIATAQIDELINNLKNDQDMTNVVVTHVMESVQRIADRVLLLDRGQVLLDGSLDELRQSVDPRIVRFVRGQIDAQESESVEFREFLDDLLM